MREVIKARDGYVLTNGKIYGKEIYLAKGADKNAFYEITEKEYEDIMSAEEMSLI